MNEEKKTDVQETKTVNMCVKDIEGLPFQLVINNDNGKTRIGLAGQLAVPTEFQNEELAIKYIKSKPWDLIIAFTFAAMEVFAKRNINGKEANNA